MSTLVFLVDRGQRMGSLLPQWSQVQRTLPAPSLPKLTITKAGHCSLARYILYVTALVLTITNTDFFESVHDFGTDLPPINISYIAIRHTRVIVNIASDAISLMHEVILFNVLGPHLLLGG